MILDKIQCGIDVGTRKIKACVVREKRKGFTELLGVEETPTRGLNGIAVNDLGGFSESIHHVLNDLVKRAGVKLKHLSLGIGGKFIECRYSKAMIPLLEKASKIITYSDIKKVNKQAKLLGVKIEEEALHDFPQQYVIDESGRVLNPVGLYARKLGVTSLLVVARQNFLANIAKGIGQAGYDVSQTNFTSFAASMVILDEVSFKQGCLLLDIGASSTSLSYFRDGSLRHLDIVPLGGEHFTRSIAEALHLPFELSEEIKKSHASALGDDIRKNGEILVKNEDGYVTVKRKLISDALEAPIGKLTESINSLLKFSHLRERLNGGIITIGGGSLLSGLIERIENETKIPSRMAKVHLNSSAVNNPSLFAGAVGTAKAVLGRPSYSSAPADPQRLLGAFSNRVRELYEEYF